jgi:hypothetical protein
MAYKKITDAEVMIAVKAAPTDAPPRDAFAARLLGCSTELVKRYRMRIEQPKKYSKVLKVQEVYGFKYRGTDHLKKHRKPPMVPTPGEIEIALKASGGDAYAAAKILGCSKTPVRNHIVAERAAGREIGNRRVFRDKDPPFNEIEAEVDFDAPAIPLTDEQLERHMKAVAFFADVLGAESAA